jgi:hypothetical protein
MEKGRMEAEGGKERKDGGRKKGSEVGCRQ